VVALTDLTAARPIDVKNVLRFNVFILSTFLNLKKTFIENSIKKFKKQETTETK